MVFILRLVISGLCAFVPLGNGNMLVLLVDARGHASVPHYPRLSVKLKNIPVGDGYGDRPFEPAGLVLADPAGDEIVNYVLEREKITIEGLLGNAPPVDTRHAWFWGPQRPYAIIPGHRRDPRWVVKTGEFMAHPNVSRQSTSGDWRHVVAAIEIPRGVMEASSVVKDTEGNYVVWDFKANGDLLHRQALADKVIIDIPIAIRSVRLRADRLTQSDPAPKRFPVFRPLRIGDIVEISITNLPLARQNMYSTSLDHFGFLCKRLAEAPGECVIPDNENIRKGRGSIGGGTIAGTGVICPMLTFQD